MDNKTISNWVRQARFRAKRHDIYSNLDIKDVMSMIEHSEHKCAYCKQNDAETLDHPFPLKDSAPNTISNIVVSCMSCKGKKKNNDLIWCFNNGIIKEEIYLALLKELFDRKNGAEIKDHVKRVSGISDIQE